MEDNHSRGVEEVGSEGSDDLIYFLYKVLGMRSVQ